MRVLLFVGKGGAGTTTVAEATAAAAARCGVKTLLVAPDDGSLSGRQPASAPGVVRETDRGPAVLTPDPATQLVRALPALARQVEPLLSAAGAAPFDAVDLLSLAGADDLVPALALREHADSGRWDLLVVDAGTTAEATRMLTTPGALLRLVDRGWPLEHRLGLRRPRPGRGTAQTVAALRDELASVVAVLGAATTSIRLVLTPDTAGMRHALASYGSFTVLGHPVDGVVANRVVPRGCADRWRSAVVDTQTRVLEEARRAFSPLVVQELPYEGAGIGAQELRRLGDLLLAGGAAADVEALLQAPPGVELRVRPTGTGYELVLPAPMVTAADVDLARDGDELRLGVGRARRVLTLPAVLRRCVARGARVEAGDLVVSFVPDPALWSRRPYGSHTSGVGER